MNANNSPPEITTRERIAETGACLFAERGFSGVSMREIADAVGIKAASLYNHFPDKESLYLAALAHSFADRIQLIDEALAVDGPAAARLRAMVIAIARINGEETVAGRLLNREMLDGDRSRLQQLTRNIFHGPFERMAALFNELAPGHNGAETAIFASALIHGYFAFAPLFPYLDADDLPTDPQMVGGRVADMMIRALQERAA